MSGKISTADAFVWENSQSSAQPSGLNIGYSQQKGMCLTVTDKMEGVPVHTFVQQLRNRLNVVLSDGSFQSHHIPFSTRNSIQVLEHKQNRYISLYMQENRGKKPM